MVTAVIILLIIALGVLSFIASNLYAQNQQLEEELMKYNELEDRVVNVYNFFLETFTSAYVEMERIDKNGAFSSDDEVGFAFRVVKEAIEHVKFQITKLKTDYIDDVK